MTLLGLHDGVSLRFDNGTLSALETGRFGRTFDLHEEFSAAPGPLGEPLPYLPLEASLDMSDARYRGLDAYSGRQIHQTFSVGQRTISILQGQSALASGLPEPLLARTRMDTNVSVPIGYRLCTSGDAVWEIDEHGAEVYLGNGCTVRVSATVALAIEDNGRCLHIDLPTGVATIEMWIEAQPPLPFSPAVVVCAPLQMREAAVVASAIGSTDRSYIPLLDLDLPPMSADDFQTANQNLAQISQQLSQIEQQITTVAQQGAQAPSGIILPGVKSAEQSIDQLEQQREKLYQDMEPLQQRMLAYATWSHRSAVVTRLIAAMTAGSTESPRLFVLSPYPTDLLAEWGTTAEMTVLFQEGATSQVAEWQETAQAVIPSDRLEVIFHKDATDLATQVWQRVRGPEQPVFFTIPDEPSFYPVGLLDALRRGRALLPRGRAGAQVKLDDIVDKLNENVTSDQVVIVESDGTISSLVGALYANHTGARLFVNPLPRADLAFDSMRVMTEGAQKEQLAAMAANGYRYIGEHRKEFMQSQTADPQLKEVAAGLSILDLPAAVPTPYSDQAFVQSLTTYLTAQQAGVQQGYRYDDAQWTKDMAALEIQVSGSISEHVRLGVANATRVTAFTSGLPYSLASGFEGKAVGLVLRDLAAPYILRAVAHEHVGRPSLAMALTVDPGLTQRPAPDVAEIVDQTVTLRTQAASLNNIAALAAVLPLDAILLQTQGGMDSLVLGDARNRLVEVHATDVGTQVRMPSMPLVIYTAPLAWLGVGVTMLEEGAGGFVGALWPLPNGAGDDAARLLLSAALVKGQNPAEALLSLPSFDPRSSRAFVYLGTASPWLAPAHKVVEGMPALYDAAARLAVTGRTEMATLVYDRLRALTGEMALSNPNLRAELMLLDADFQTRQTSHRRERPAQEMIDRVWQNLDLLDKVGLPEHHKKELQVAIWERAAVLEMAVENYERAAELLQSVSDAYKQNGQTSAALSTTYLLAIVRERQQQWAAARQSLLDVQSGLADTGNAVGLVSVSTSLAYVSLPLHMYPDVLSHLKVAMQASIALGTQVLSETLVQTLQVGRVMAQMGATADLVTLTRTLSDIVRSDTRLAKNDRTAIADMLTMMQETADVLNAGLPAEEREKKLAALVEKAQGSELAQSLGLDAWILSAGSPPGAAEDEGKTG